MKKLRVRWQIVQLYNQTYKKITKTLKTSKKDKKQFNKTQKLKEKKYKILKIEYQKVSKKNQNHNTKER